MSDDAVWVDGPQGVRRGADAILDVLTAQLAFAAAAAPARAPEISTLVADGGTVMVEWRGTMGDKSFTVMAVFEVADGRIKEMREAYDLQSVLDQMQAVMGDATQ